MRHSRQCPAYRDPEAECRGFEGRRGAYRCSIEAWAFDARSGRKKRETFSGKGALSAASQWRSEAKRQLGRGELTAEPTPTLKAAAAQLTEGIRSGTIRKKGGSPYSARVAKDYAESLAIVVPMLAEGRKLDQILPDDIERLVRELRGKGLSESRIRNLTNPLRVIFRLHRRQIPMSPMAGVEIGQAGKRERAAGPAEITALLASLDAETKTAYALAGYAGLRAAEILGLDIANVKIAEGVIVVERSFDHHTQTWKEPKSKAGIRRVPVKATGPLLRIIIEHQAQNGRTEGLLLGPDGETPLVLISLHRRAKRAWKATNKGRAERAKREGRDLKPDELINPIGLHELRHSAGSNWLAAGVPLPRVSRSLGHAHVGITASRYAHALDGGDAADAALVEAYHASLVG